VIADVSGYLTVTAACPPVAVPTRLLDTRNGIGGPVAPVAASGTVAVDVSGVAPIGTGALGAVALDSP